MLVCLLQFLFLPSAYGTTGEEELVTNIFTYYDKKIRPTTRNSVTVVTVELAYFILLAMEQQEEYITFGSDVRMSWFDPIIVWTPNATNDNTQRLLLKETTIWRPDIAVVNSLSQTEIITEDERLAEVLYNGTVHTTNPSVYDTWCKLDLDNFPFDTQVCTINIGSWVYSAAETLVVTNQNESSFDVDETTSMFDGNSEWEVTQIETLIDISEEEGDTYQEVHYSISLRRRASYYIYVLLVPTFIVTTLCILGLFTPLDNFGNRAERATLGLTTLLSLSVILNLVGDGMPKQSRLSRLAAYVLAEIIVCSIGVLITIGIQMAHQRVSTRLLMPPSQKVREKFPHSQPDKLGLRVLVSAHGGRERSHIVDEIEKTLGEINDYIDQTSRREELLLYWVKVYDRLDIFFLIILQFANIILTIIVFTVNF